MGRWMLMCAACVSVAATVQGHHAISAVYDTSRRVTIEGIVAQFQLVNPHPFLLVDVQEGGAKTQQWRLEMDNLSELREVGVTAGTWKPGDRVVVAGSLARAQAHSLYIQRLDRHADGFWYEQVGQSPKIGTSASIRR